MTPSNSPKGKKGGRPKAINHKTLMAPMSAEAGGQDQSVFGHARAVVTVCNCANTSPANLSHTLSELGVNGLSFQQCVFGTVTSLGFTIKLDDIPDSPSSTLISVVDVITNANEA